MQGNTQFWLQICPAYIFDNFDRLVSYLRQYTYDFETPERNADFNSTVDVMTEMCRGYASQILNSPFDLPSFDAPEELIIRLFGATILAANKRRQAAGELIPPFVSLLTRAYGKYQEEDLIKLANISRNASIGLQIDKFGFNFNHLEKEHFSTDLTANVLLHMSFKSGETNSRPCIIENHGVAEFRENEPVCLFIGNSREFFKTETTTLFEVPGLVKLAVEKNANNPTGNFKSLVNTSRKLLLTQEGVKPSTTGLRNYMPSDEFIVRITELRNALVVAETISPDHHLLSGKVNIQTGTSVKHARQELLATLKVGDNLRVRLDPSDEFTFTIADTFEEFYRYLALRSAGSTAFAVFEKTLNKNHVFTTEEGVRFNIFHESKDDYSDIQLETLDKAITEGVAIKALILDARCKIDDPKFVLYGKVERSGDYIPHGAEGDFNVGEANGQLVDSFLYDCDDEAKQILSSPMAATQAIDKTALSPLLTILHEIIKDGFDDARTRVEYSTLACVMSKILEFRKCVELFESDTKIVSAMVNFAQGEEIREVTIPADLADSPEISQQTELLGVLREYKLETSKQSKEDTLQKVKKLVEASNNLRDILDRQELSAIKRIIARTIGVEDEFVSHGENRTFYGIESDNLEFKSSIVFPPANRRRIKSAIADPSLQKWAIIRTICGFLNSEYGGELLLGVRDTGYACGIEEDIRELYQRGLIAFKSADAYRTYVQNVLDSAFSVEKSPKILSESITRSSLTYAIEKSREGADILRIKVAPYAQGLVAIKPANDRPHNLANIYERKSGRTVALTDDMRRS